MEPFTNTRFEDPVPVRSRKEIDERARRAHRIRVNTLILCDTAADCTAEAIRLQAGPLAGKSLGLDATGMSVREFCEAIYSRLAGHFGWPALEPFDRKANVSGYKESWAARDALETTMVRLAAEPNPGSHPVLLVWGIDSKVALIFATGRDEMWGVNLPWVVLAPWADKDQYLLRYSDSFFCAGKLHRLTGETTQPD